jgi:hypothetical protein
VGYSRTELTSASGALAKEEVREDFQRSPKFQLLRAVSARWLPAVLRILHVCVLRVLSGCFFTTKQTEMRNGHSSPGALKINQGRGEVLNLANSLL